MNTKQKHQTGLNMNSIVIFLITIALSTLLIAIGNVFGLIPAFIIEQSKMSTLPAIAISSEVYLEKLLSRYFTDWYITGQEELTVYAHQFFKRKMFPDLVLKHKETGKIMVFDAKFKTMRFVKQDLDRADFYQIHSYIQYYLPKVVLGGLLYPLSKDNNGDSNYASSLFENEANDTGFIIDGIFLKEGMSEQQINSNELEFLSRLKDAINRKLVS